MPNFSLKLYNYDKPGKGVEKDEDESPALIKLFTLYFRNFWKMTLYNLIYFLTTLPIISSLVAFIIILMGESKINALVSAESFESFNQSYPWVMIWINVYDIFTSSNGILILGVLLLLAALLCFGPISAGLSYCMRNFIRIDHVFTSDLFTNAWENRKQAIIIGLIDIFATVSIILYFLSDFSNYNAGYAELMSFLKYFALFIYILYLVARIYMYMIMVTFDMPLKEIIRNSFILTYSNLPRTLLMWISILLLIAINILLPLPSLFLLLLFDFSFLIFLCCFIVYPVINKNMIKPALENIENKDK